MVKIIQTTEGGLHPPYEFGFFAVFPAGFSGNPESLSVAYFKVPHFVQWI